MPKSANVNDIQAINPSSEKKAHEESMSSPISELNEHIELNAQTQEMTQTQNVRKIVEFILNCKMQSYEKEKFFKKRFPNFASSMPKLFDMVIRDNLTEQHHTYIKMMLYMSERLLD